MSDSDSDARSAGDLASELARLRASLDARAAGFWWVSGGQLVLAAFDAAPDMPAEVGAAFQQATRAVPLDRPELGIVQAARSGEAAVSVADEIDASVGSGHWLRAFGAQRSIAVPLNHRRGGCRAVLAVAQARSATDSKAVVERLNIAGERMIADDSP